jgi:hypothetical protein
MENIVLISFNGFNTKTGRKNRPYPMSDQEGGSARSNKEIITEALEMKRDYGEERSNHERLLEERVQEEAKKDVEIDGEPKIVEE